MTTIKHLEETTEGVYTAVYTVKRYRFLLEDGRTVDIDAIQTDSNLAAAVLSHFGATRIIGFADITPPAAPEEPTQPVKKAVAAKKAAPAARKAG